MNQRIQQLAKQAGYQPLPGFDFANSLEEVFIKKFAQLLVQRTLEIVEAHTEIFQSDQARAMVEHIKQSVKTDLGVES